MTELEQPPASEGAPPPRILAISNGQPFDRLTWSGSTYHLLTALRQAGVLADAVDVRSNIIERLSQLATFAPSRRRWMQRYMTDASPFTHVLRSARTRSTVKLATASAEHADALLQIGNWSDGSEIPGMRTYASYHDGNLALYLRRPDALLRGGTHAVRSAMQFEQRVYDHMDIVFTMSEWLRESFIEDFNQDPNKVKAVGAGANLDELPPSTERRWEPPRLLFVGKGDFARKGGPILLQAFGRVRARHPEVELWMVGPAIEPEAPAGVRYFGRISRATPTGQAGFAQICREATCFVLPSLFEPFGVAFLEAMAYGLPCVGTESCAMPEIVEHGVTGLLAAPGDVDSLTECLLELVAAPDRAAAMGAAGRRRMVERFTWTAVSERMIQAFRGQLAE